MLAFVSQALSKMMQHACTLFILQNNRSIILLLHTVACTCPQATVTVTVLSVLLSLVLTLSLSTYSI